MAKRKLAQAQRDKIEPRLQLWLDGVGTPEDLGFAPSPEGPHAVRVAVELSEPIPSAEARRYRDLGVERVAGFTVVQGLVSRDQLVALVQEARVVQVEPEGLTKLMDSPP
jgi:hypothetical protein